MFIDTGKNSNEIAVELVKNLADIRSGDFVVAMDEHNIVLVKDVEDIDSPKLQGKSFHLLQEVWLTICLQRL